MILEATEAALALTGTLNDPPKKNTTESSIKHATLIVLSGTCILIAKMCSIKGSVDGYASATNMSARKLIDTACNCMCDDGKIIRLEVPLKTSASEDSTLTSKLRIEFWSSLKTTIIGRENEW